MTNHSSPAQPSPCYSKHPLLGLWNPTYKGWLISDVVEVSGDSDIWTPEFDKAQVFRTEAAAQTARVHLRDFYGIDAAVCVLNYG